MKPNMTYNEWFRRANDAALGGGQDIMPDPPVHMREWDDMSDNERWAEMHGYVRYRCPVHGPFWSDSGPHCEHCELPDPYTDEDFEQENEV